MKKLFTLFVAMLPGLASLAQPDGNVYSSRTGAGSSGGSQVSGGYVPSPASVIFSDDMDAPNDTNGLQLRGYATYFRGTGPMGLAPYWFQGSAGVFTDFNGVQADGYVASNYQSVTNINNIDNWLVLPPLNIDAGDTLSFYSRSPVGSTWPDSIRVMFNATGASLPEDPNWVELGRFKVNIIGIWERRFFLAPASGANARFAIRYSVIDGGPNGPNSNYIGIDQIDVIEGSASGITALSAGPFHGIYVYPVPVNNIAHFSINAGEPIQAKIMIKDNLGRQVFLSTENLKMGVNLIRVNLADLSPGMYFVTVSSPKGMLNARFIKQ